MCLHTAGADSRQYRGLLNDAETLAKFRVIAFDLPWHGKSSPPAGWHKGEYKLTSRAYVDTIMAVIDALGLDKPVVMGCSIGGRIVLHLALEHATRFRALIGLESGAHAEPYYDLDWLHRPDVHGGEMCGAIDLRPDRARPRPRPTAGRRSGTTCRAAPASSRATCTSIPPTATCAPASPRSTPAKCPLYLLTGEYDYSCTPARHARPRRPHQGRRGHHHGWPRPLPRERGPGPVHVLSAARCSTAWLPARSLEVDQAISAT